MDSFAMWSSFDSWAKVAAGSFDVAANLRNPDAGQTTVRGSKYRPNCPAMQVRVATCGYVGLGLCWGWAH